MQTWKVLFGRLGILIVLTCSGCASAGGLGMPSLAEGRSDDDSRAPLLGKGSDASSSGESQSGSARQFSRTMPPTSVTAICVATNSPGSADYVEGEVKVMLCSYNNNSKHCMIVETDQIEEQHDGCQNHSFFLPNNKITIEISK